MCPSVFYTFSLLISGVILTLYYCNAANSDRACLCFAGRKLLQWNGTTQEENEQCREAWGALCAEKDGSAKARW